MLDEVGSTCQAPSHLNGKDDKCGRNRKRVPVRSLVDSVGRRYTGTAQIVSIISVLEVNSPGCSEVKNEPLDYYRGRRGDVLANRGSRLDNKKYGEDGRLMLY